MKIKATLNGSVKPVVFEEFFAIGKDESASPFLTPSSRKWADRLSLKGAIVAAFLLLASFLFSAFFHQPEIASILLIFVYFLAGISALVDACEDILTGEINIDVLMTLAAFSSVLIGSSFEGGLLLVLFALSGSIEELVSSKAKNSISELNKLSPTKATVVQPGDRYVDKSVRDVVAGDLILIRPGEIVPLDGVVIAGKSFVNLVHLTGESLPVIKQKDDEVAAGARNLDGALTIKVTHTAADSTLAKIVELVTNAQEAKPRLQQWFDRFSRIYALSIIGFSASFAALLPLISQISFLGDEGSLYRALSFLIAASPCALILAVPIAYLSAISSCAKKGIILKGGVVLDSLADCKTIAFDKTGTLTTGELTCKGVERFSGNIENFSDIELWQIAHGLEKQASHPIAASINRYAEGLQVVPIDLTEFKSLPGSGILAKAQLKGTEREIFIGHSDYAFQKLSDSLVSSFKQIVAQRKESGDIFSILMIGENLFFFTFEDTLRESLKETFAKIIQKKCWDLLMLTGDHEKSAQKIAKSLNIGRYYADLKPEDKLKHVSDLAASGSLAMVGDGINDAPALARSNVGICMGKFGSGVALDAADIVLLHDNLDYLDWLLSKALLTKKIVKQNLILAVVAILLAATASLAGFIPLWLAVIMHEGGTVLVGLNALRLL